MNGRGGGASRSAGWAATLTLTLSVVAAACASVAPSTIGSSVASDSPAQSAHPTAPTPLPIPVVASPPPPAPAWRAVPLAPRGRVADIIQTRDGRYLAVGTIEWNGAVWRSVDGIAWSEVADVPPIGPQDAKGLSGVIQTANGFLGWGGGGARYSEGGFSVIWTSSDGTKWLERAGWTGFLVDVEEGGPGFVGVGSMAGLDNLYGALAWSSIDGITWTESPQVPGEGGTGMFDLLPFEDGFLAIGASRDGIGGVDGIVWRSDDGVVWTEVPNVGLEGNGLSSVMISGGRLHAASWTTLNTISGELNRPGIWTSQDGSSWTQPYAPHCCGQMLDIVDTGTELLGLYRWYVPEGETGTALLRSSDGERWLEIGSPQLDEGILWERILNVGGSLGVIGLALGDIGNEEFQPVLLLPPADLFSH